MVTVIDPLYKAKDAIKFGWRPEYGAASYNMYVGLVPSPLTLLYSGISAAISQQPSFQGMVPYTAQIADVRTKLSLASTVDFSNKIFYFSLTYVDSTGATSSISDSTVVEVFPVGIMGYYAKEDPTANRHEYVFSHDALKWAKMAGSGQGAVITDPSDFYKSNIILEYTYDTSNLKTIKSYPTDSTLAGAPAKLTTYTYSGSQVTKVVITDSTV